MPKLSDVTVEVNARLGVDRRTAETCLRLVETFCNANGMHLLANRIPNGELEFSFERDSFPKVSEDTIAAINAIGRGTHHNEL
jgi:hypothetical protein